MADVLFGLRSPGGKLPITVPRSMGQTPSACNRKPSGNRSFFHEYYMDCPNPPLFPFGHGLSYTSFAYADLQLEPREMSSGGTADIRLRIADTGKAAGDEVMRLCVCDEPGSVPRPVMERKGFQRVSLEPGESRRLTFHLPVDLLAFCDEKPDLAVESGTVRIMAGGSSSDNRLNGSFDTVGPEKSKIARRVFVCPVTVEQDRTACRTGRRTRRPVRGRARGFPGVLYNGPEAHPSDGRRRRREGMRIPARNT